MRTRQAVLLGTAEFDGDITTDGAVTAVAIELLACRAGAVAVVFSKFEVVSCVALGFAGMFFALVPERIRLGLVDLLISVAFIAFAITIVGNIGINLFFSQCFEVGF